MVGTVTLTTDFGLRDAYVAEMKGVMLSIARASGHALQLVDVTHDVERHDITEGALALEAAAPFFPSGTVHLAVVDPGVGTSRRGLAVAADGYLLVGPDNGLFTPFLTTDGWSAFEIAEADYRLPFVSRTFHGRDLFAPAAAHLALGLDPARLGPAVSDPVLLAWPEVRAVAGAVAGAVVHTDRFGNLITSIHARSVEPLDADVLIRVGGREVPLAGTYAELPVGRAGALVGSAGRLEIAVREGSAAAVLRAQRGTSVVVSRRTSSSRRPRRRR